VVAVTSRDDIVLVEAPPETERIEREDVIEIGQWYWIKHKKKKTLVCVMEVGSNYAELYSVRGEHGGSTIWRVHFDDFHEQCTRELDADRVIAGEVERHRLAVARLMDKVKQLTSRLGLTPKGELVDENEAPCTALAVAHATEDITAHKKALIKAQKKTFPALFKEIEREHKMMASWMKAQLMPLQAESSILEERTKGIKDRIFTVELYAGLIEELVQIRRGKPAPNDTKVALYQRRHYMDEECLAEYEAGGMDYKSIKQFDRWLLSKNHWKRLLPSLRCVVAFQIRRHAKERDEPVSYSDFIRFWYERDADTKTFLYIRNGSQVYRLSTGIDFGEELFPDRKYTETLGDGQLWMCVKHSHVERVVGQREYDGLMEEQREHIKAQRRRRQEWFDEQAKLPKKDRDNPFFAPEDPDGEWRWHRWGERWSPCTPESVYYDDAMRLIARQAMDHNRMAVVLQGLLDRSPAFQPHPPWQLWTPEGFMRGIELVYDVSRALEPGEAPDFEAYRARLNASLKRGSLTVGQQDLWERAEAAKEYERQSNDWRVQYPLRTKRYRPYGNPGPGLIAEVVRLGRKGQCTYEWLRERLIYKRWGNRGDITTRFTCNSSQILCIDNYTPGDFKQFFADHRTREQYLKWAPLLLAAEDYWAKKAKE